MTHKLPALLYPHAALEPHIDAQTMMLHHDKHHASYVTGLNAALEHSPQLQTRSASWLLLNLDQIPEDVRIAVRNNAGGHLNHSLLWRAMSPTGNHAPSGLLAEAIERDFGSFEQFKTEFEAAGTKLFGSGWVWLVRTPDDGGKLTVSTTTGHDNPLMQGQYPVLVNDVWEHAYYLKHQNRRADYLRQWWALANWDEASRRFGLAGAHSAEQEWEDDGGALRKAA